MQKGGDFVPKTKVRSFCFDGDVLEVVFRYDDVSGMHFGEYPDFGETPRHTPGGRPWVNAIQDACQHGVNQYDSAHQCLDCGSCRFYLKEHPGDLIGICKNEHKRKKYSSLARYAKRKDDVK
ncbi:MAG: hypothetical protein IJX76_06570 [Clostridia bacterium]|nr:hypothetical protein [Clostridia bacterium]